MTNAMAPHRLDKAFADPAKAREAIQPLIDAAIKAGVEAEKKHIQQGVGANPGQTGASAFAQALGMQANRPDREA